MASDRGIVALVSTAVTSGHSRSSVGATSIGRDLQSRRMRRAFHPLDVGLGHVRDDRQLVSERSGGAHRSQLAVRRVAGLTRDRTKRSHRAVDPSCGHSHGRSEHLVERAKSLAVVLGRARRSTVRPLPRDRR